MGCCRFLGGSEISFVTAYAAAAKNSPSFADTLFASISLQRFFYEFNCLLDMPLKFCNPRRSQVTP